MVHDDTLTPIDVPLEVLAGTENDSPTGDAATAYDAQGAAGIDYSRDAHDAVSRLRDANVSAEPTGIDALRMTASRATRDPFAKLRPMTTVPISPLVTVPAVANPTTVPFTQPVSAGGLSAVSSNTPIALATDDEEFFREVAEMIDRYRDGSYITSADIGRVAMPLYLPPLRTQSPNMREMSQLRVDAYVSNALSGYAKRSRDAVEERAETTARRLRMLDDQLPLTVNDLSIIRPFALDHALQSLLREMQSSALAPHDATIISASRDLPRIKGAPQRKETVLGSVGPMLIDDVIEYSTLAFAYRTSGADGTAALSSWQPSGALCIGSYWVPTDFLAGDAAPVQPIRIYDRVNTWLREQQSEVYVRQRLEDIIFPNVIAGMGSGMASFIVQPVDAGSAIPSTMEETTVESREVPFVKVPISICDGPLSTTAHGGRYGMIAVTAHDDVMYSSALSVQAYTAALDVAKENLRWFDDKVFSRFLRRV